MEMIDMDYGESLNSYLMKYVKFRINIYFIYN